LHNEELHNLYASPNIIRVTEWRRMRRAEYRARMEEMRNVYNILVGKCEWRRPPGRPRRRWENNIIMDLKEIVWEVVDWIHPAQVWVQWWALVNRVMNFRVP
jgi:hypothetical protein